MPGTGVAPLTYGEPPSPNKAFADTSPSDTESNGFDIANFREEGRASWYGRFFSGHRTASGERYNMNAMTAAHKTLPLSSYVRVTNTDNDKSIIVRINDRGPYVKGRIIDLSYAAARKLGFHHFGTANVKLEGLTTQEAKAEMHEEKLAAAGDMKGDSQP